MARRCPRRWAAVLALSIGLAAGCGTDQPAQFSPAQAPTPTGSAPGTAPPATTAAPTTPTPSVSPSSTARPSQPPRRSARYVFPVKAAKASFGRTHSEYPASDIFAACGSPVLATTDGVVLEVSLVDRYDAKTNPAPADRGGLSVSLLGDDGVRYYGSHLSSVAGGVRAGVRVSAGQRIGSVGSTGRASGVCHLHFGISPPCQRTADWWIRRGVVWPARYLEAWRAGKALSAVAAVTSWRRANGCPASP